MNTSSFASYLWISIRSIQSVIQTCCHIKGHYKAGILYVQTAKQIRVQTKSFSQPIKDLENMFLKPLQQS